MRKSNQIQVAIDFVRSGCTCKQAALIAGLSVKTVERSAKKAGLSTHKAQHDQIPIALFNLLKSSAKAREIDFAVTVEDLAQLFRAQSGKCALTGVLLEMRRKEKCRWLGNASLDRIDSKKGYCKGNIQWVTKEINLAKQQLTQTEFIAMCKKVAKNNG